MIAVMEITDEKEVNMHGDVAVLPVRDLVCAGAANEIENASYFDNDFPCPTMVNNHGHTSFSAQQVSGTLSNILDEYFRSLMISRLYLILTFHLYSNL